MTLTLKQKKDIPKVMKILEKHFNYKEKTTLNKMKEKNISVSSKPRSFLFIENL